MQTKLMSFIEALINVAIGYTVAVTAQVLVFPLFGINVPVATNLMIGAVFTLISITRSYFVRRLFNWLHGKPKDRIPEDNVRCAHHYLMHSLVNLLNEYGAGGAWSPANVCWYRLNNVYQVSEEILTKGLKATHERLKEERKEFKAE